ncbi:efflux RND transporter periplasmic adaptor subunit [Brevibacterium sp. JNUCC-42]|nr:efflux RND transporter periplasmic adaptor subunit [Brevibacterium sp. JNUCC-42]
MDAKPILAAHSVTVQEAKVESFSDKQTFIGTITADVSGSVVPQVTGTIIRLYVKKGERVRKGQVIGEIDSTQKQLEVREAETKLAEAKARLTQAETVRTADNSHSSDALTKQALENARKSYERVKKLVEVGALPASQLDAAEEEWIRAQSNYRVANVSDAKDQAGITVSSVQVEGAKITLDKAKKALGDTKIKAPMDGTINNLLVTVGDAVSPQAAIAEIVSLDHVTVTIQISEDYLPSLSKGKSVQVSIPTVGIVTEAQVTFIGLTASLQTKLYPVEIRLANPSQALRPGMRADVTIAAQKEVKGIVLPIESIVEEEGKSFVFITKGDQAIKQEVKIMDSNATSVLIGEGVAPGDLVVVSGQSELKDDDVVEIIKK